jgi:hypothetical protein
MGSYLTTVEIRNEPERGFYRLWPKPRHAMALDSTPCDGTGLYG